ncbi:MAG: DinB family protein [candidate division Zixibacteria bacterium]|nr:DinB family protein [candidate division Zixibacteria bacterium]MDH3939000.1 DinB family protein [candidate division Zixibacteria bacterium]MDH4033856.1 DinB family protein [candidate division Zixibacteria bacterium]
MNQKVALFAKQYQINRWLISSALKDLSQEAIESRIEDKGNSMKWLVGHLASSRFVVLSHIGIEQERPFGDLFARGAEVKDAADYPSYAEILKVWEEVADKVEARFEELTDDDLGAPMDAQYPISDGTALSGIAFLALHETYHAGQLAYIRRLNGGDQITG